ncbi:hypothetical protein QFC20_005236 [Naganishia adeliensis]|uniref:Uncharacterized protein n=1 Tax=Naganishia adeliensis TaxID=92952 RepID=A0ACC2VQ50_9TREE|nr:hypothetical protein QFC20_005236 [Naganishia adeliensis]
MLSQSTNIFRSAFKAPVRAFSVSATRAMPVRSQVSGADGKALEDEKQKNLSGTQKSTHPEDAPGWNELLASESEAVIKAERAQDEPFEKLQKETIKHVHKD